MHRQQEQAGPGQRAAPRVTIVVSDYNAWITERLLAGAMSAAERRAPDAAFPVLRVPGSWELVAGAAAGLTASDAVVCLGCVIKGETSHDRYINTAVSNALAHLSATHTKPVGFGLLTVDDAEQAEARAGGAMGNKGEEAMDAVLDTLASIAAFEGSSASSGAR